VPDDEAGAVDHAYPSAPPELIRPADVELPALLGATRVTVWPSALYVAELIGGADARPLVNELRRGVAEASDQLAAAIDAWQSPSAIVELDSEREPWPDR
jgi:hypothetical protein